MLACEAGARRGNETQEERWSGGREGSAGTMVTDREGRPIRTARRQRGGPLPSNEGRGEKVEGIPSIKGR